MQRLPLEWNADGRMQQAVAITEKQRIRKFSTVREDEPETGCIARDFKYRLADD